MKITDSQEKIIRSPASAKLMVKAGPGTGKTFSLIERIKYLVKTEQLEPATEILVLSFSVAASQEIKNRLQVAVEEQGYDDALLHIIVRTFDSFASSFMFRLDPDIKLDSCDYEQRISMVTEIIESREDARSRLHRYRHILVDEVQDLVGLRASLTLAVLTAAGGGFTLFGDPAQAVYNHLMGEDEQGLTSDEFLKQVYHRNDSQVEDFFLTDNFRVGGNAELKEVAEAGRKYLLESPPKVAYNFLRRTFADLTSLGSLNDAVVPDHLRSGTTAFLCRTNGQGLRLARCFRDQGVDFFIRQPLEEKDIPAWVGHIFSNWSSQTVTKKAFFEAVEILSGNNVPEAKQAWQELQMTAKIKSSIRVPQLRSVLLEEGVFTISATEERSGVVVISTIHRSKGREFDDVVLVIPEETDPDEFLDEGRVMFVGLTRACCSLRKMSENGAKGIYKSGDRWSRSINANGRRRLTGIEVGCRGDVDIRSPVSLAMFDGDVEEIQENQELLWEDVFCGSSVRLELYRMNKGIPIYYIKISVSGEDLAVGLTSERFGYSIKKVIADVQETRPSCYPGVIDDLWVRDVVTEVGNLGNEDVPRSYRTTGLWLGVRLQGLGTCREWRART